MVGEKEALIVSEDNKRINHKYVLGYAVARTELKR